MVDLDTVHLSQEAHNERIQLGLILDSVSYNFAHVEVFF
jgi:hypothetical protein